MEQRDNSVVFSLRELQKIEEQRVEEETQAALQSAEEIRAAKEAEELAAKQAEEAAIRAEREAEAARLAAIQERNRQEAMQLQAEETRARVAAETKLAQQRAAEEQVIKKTEAKKKRPWPLMALAAILAVAVGGTAYYAFSKAAENERISEQNAAKERKLLELQRTLTNNREQVASLQAKLDAGATAEEAEKLRNQIAGLHSQSKAAAGLSSRGKSRGKSTRIRKSGGGKGKTSVKLSAKCRNNPFADGCI